MNTRGFENLSEQEKALIERYLNGTLDRESFETFENRLGSDSDLRRILRRVQALDSHLREGSAQGDAAMESWLKVEGEPQAERLKKPAWVSRMAWPIAAAACLALFLGTLAIRVGERSEAEIDSGQSRSGSAQGFAVIDRLLYATWEVGADPRSVGDILAAETFRLAAGTAEIRFFSGASMTVRGPAEIALNSAWEATCLEGSVRMRVPPAARGFKLNAPSTEIVDLGTEFGLEVRDGYSHLEVFDGEIAMRHQQHPEQRVTEGFAWTLPNNGAASPTVVGRKLFPDLARFDARIEDLHRSEFDRWLLYRDELASDPNLIAYYTFERESWNDPIFNLSGARDAEKNGTAILAQTVDGRWKRLKPALEFRRPGSRVRVNIPGEFSAFTFVCWARVDSLDRQYSALFMGDGYETGEPHWQINEDGKLMVSVMVDDARPHPKYPKDSGFHKLYYSPPFWDQSMSGRWVHLASVYDPQRREVSHYVDGERIHREDIEDEYFIDRLRIGAAEIGNWSQPFRTDPRFAIRNINGQIDELAVFQTALDPEAIKGLYDRSRSTVR